MSSDATTLVDAMRLFLARHEEALAGGEPARGLEACEGLVEALGGTLPEELSRVPDASPRHAMARAVLEKRMAEMEGLAWQLKLAFHQLEERNVDVMRLVALLTATRRQLRALQTTLELWAAEHGAPAPREPAASEAVRAAREALAAGCGQAARDALRVALARAGKTLDVGEGGDLVTAWRALDEVEVALRPPIPS